MTDETQPKSLEETAAAVLARNEPVEQDRRSVDELLDAFDQDAATRTAYTVNRATTDEGEHVIRATNGDRGVRIHIEGDNLEYGRGFILSNLLVTLDDFYDEPQAASSK